ncbi:MAG: hypothetical protein E6R07_01165 [Nevskiaceae bacterium]|nr:MAG: hypothetical protein E6R07_01165 [Nevskiaceae bacterium]
MPTLPPWLQVTLAVIPGISAVFAACALFLNFSQSRKTNKQARATLVASALKGFTDDKDIQAAFYSIEYGQFTYGADFHTSELEQKIDKLLRHFSNLALSWKAGLLTTSEVLPLQYYIQRVMKNPEIDKYVSYIGEWSADTRLGQHPYGVLVELSDALSKTTKSRVSYAQQGTQADVPASCGSAA